MIPRQKQPDEFNLCPEPSADEQADAQERSDALDFLEEDLALERELNALFNPESENLPPLYVQTLMTERSTWAIPPGLEERLIARTFRRLQLPLPTDTKEEQEPPHQPSPGYRLLRRLPRPIGVGATLGLVLLLLIFLLPGLGQEAHILFLQAQLPVPGYAGASSSPLALTQYLSARQTAEDVPFPIYWLNRNPVNYTFQSFLLHMNQPWSDGPVVEFQYGHTNPRIGYGRLIIREFHPAGGDTPLEIVDPGAARVVQLGDTSAVYINGQWVQENGEIIWQTGVETQLLYQASDGLVFWFIADARDEATLSSFESLVGALEPLYLGPPRPQVPELNSIPQAEAAASLPAAAPGTVVSQLLVGESADQTARIYIILGALTNNAQNISLPVGGGSRSGHPTST